jgi:hypothetical protein
VTAQITTGLNCLNIQKQEADSWAQLMFTCSTHLNPVFHSSTVENRHIHIHIAHDKKVSSTRQEPQAFFACGHNVRILFRRTLPGTTQEAVSTDLLQLEAGDTPLHPPQHRREFKPLEQFLCWTSTDMVGQTEGRKQGLGSFVPILQVPTGALAWAGVSRMYHYLFNVLDNPCLMEPLTKY